MATPPRSPGVSGGRRDENPPPVSAGPATREQARLVLRGPQAAPPAAECGPRDPAATRSRQAEHLPQKQVPAAEILAPGTSCWEVMAGGRLAFLSPRRTAVH